jgi:uncharacterized membrane protein YqaE (UPF0057 family)
MDSYAVKQALPKKGGKIQRHHGYNVILFIFGTLFPPLAVAARFGIGKDFWINLLCTICGYFPGHGHNFYIQNIRNNKNHARTPKWAQRYGLVDTSEIKRKERKSQWANRYNERLPHSAHENQPYAEGQEAGSSVDLSSVDGQSSRRAQPDNSLWRPEDESYYNGRREESGDNASGRWHYPANFDDAGSLDGSKQKKKKKKNRWERTEDAYTYSEEQGKTKKKKKKSSSRSHTTESIQSVDSEFPEDPEGGLYGDSRASSTGQPGRRTTTNDDLNHEF